MYHIPVMCLLKVLENICLVQLIRVLVFYFRSHELYPVTYYDCLYISIINILYS